ncbi:hypothetical protein HAHE_32360 [Haloferula helveola]|uniref:Cytochrome c domain-containing protein n=1 Tax=Haloferula helveola TaxID=490095 RepID=A0ABN6HBW6_9BACT|nr:hypothetical protein HAHE_32360 [Haloferula helveola]
MSFRQFAIGLTASFGIAWLAVVVVPFFKLRNPAPIAFQEGVDTQEGIYHPKRAGRVANGAHIYAANGCYECHTQVARPSYAGNDLGRQDLAGLAPSLHPDGVDSRRESNIYDYIGLDFAPIGVTRLGPDLSNLGRRVEAEHGADAKDWLMLHLYDPRLDPARRNWSSCPSMSFFFEKREITGQPSDDALGVTVKKGWEVVPGEKAEALVSYLLSLKHDDPVPASMNYAPIKGDDNNEG